MRKHRAIAGFTLTEALVSSSVLAMVLGLVLSMTDQTQKLMRGTSSKVEQFREARIAFDTLSRRLSQATLNTYWDHKYETVSQNIAGRKVHVRMPVGYERGSELRFRCGRMAELNGRHGKNFQPTHGVFFQAPNGYVEDTAEHGALDHLLNTWGYFLELNTDDEFVPDFIKGKVSGRKRFRLMELMQPSEELSVYQFQLPKTTEWFGPLINSKNRPVRALCENIVALILLPKLSPADEDAQIREGRSTLLAPFYRYDTTQSSEDPVLNPKHQLPPNLELVMVAIDEASATRLEGDYRNQAALGMDYGSLFTRPELLHDNPGTQTPGDGDIAKFESMLSQRLRVSYRVFTTVVSIRGAKWSRSQEH